jgi:flagellar hook-associated protein 1 FlgK
MPGLGDILETARRAIMSQRVGINVTSNNIANANTPGYTRQRLELNPTPDLRVGNSLFGTGVSANQVSRIRNRFLDQQVRTTTDVMNNAQTKQGILSQVEAIFNEPSDQGVSGALQRFFNSFQALSQHPEDPAARYSVQQQATSLTQNFQQLSGALTQLQTDVGSDIDTKVAQLNALTSDIGDLNIKIVGQTATGADPLALKDQRDLKIEQLAQLAHLNVADESDGSVTVSIGGTVVASKAGQLKLTTVHSGGSIQLATGDQSQTVNVQSGELGGALSAFNTTIPGYLDKLNTMAKTLIDRVNTIHAASFGNGVPPSTGIDFFTGSNAADIAVSTFITSDITKIAVSGDGTAGDNSGALAIAGIKDEKLLNNGTTSITGFYNGLVGQIGTDVKSASDDASMQNLLYTQLDNQRSAVSGVSIDEEMTQLIEYQRSFAAASRVITTVDDMYQTLINMV